MVLQSCGGTTFNRIDFGNSSDDVGISDEVARMLYGTGSQLLCNLVELNWR